MVLDQLVKEIALFVAQHVVKADARADKDLFYPRQRAQLAQKRQIIAFVGVERRAGRGKQALAVGTGSRARLFFAGRVAEIGRRPADVVNIAFKIGVFQHLFRFAQHRIVPARRNVAPLVQRQRAKIARAEAAAVVNDGKLYLFNGGDAALRLVIRVIPAGIGQVENGVQLPALERAHRRVLDEHPAVVRLKKGVPAHKILLVLLGKGGAGIALFIAADLVKAGQQHRVFKGARFRPGGQETGAAHVADIACALAFFQPAGDFDDRLFAHAVNEQIGAAVDQHRTAHLVVPVIVMGKTAQRRFDAADDNGQAGEGAARQAGIDNDGAIGAAAGGTAGGIRVLFAAAARHRIVRHHRVDIARVDQNTEPRPAHGFKIDRRMEVRLGQNGDAEAVFL